MADRFQRRIADLMLSHRRRARYVAVLVCSALVVVMGVAVALSQPGQAKTHEETVLDCQYSGNGAHTHDASCYDADGNLVCPLEEREYHVHDDSCYASETYLVCGLEEGAGAHAHDESCYDEEGNLVCGLEESEGHVHTDECWQTDTWLDCGKDEVTETHVHGDGCFRTVVVDDGEDEPAAEPEVGAEADSEEGTESEATGDAEQVAAEPAKATGEAVKASDGKDANAMPAQTFKAELKEIDENGNEKVVLTVNVKAPEGAFPEGTYMVVKSISPTDVEKPVEDALAAKTDAKVTEIQSVDIAFFNRAGDEIEPAKQILVTLASPLIADNDDAYIVHVDDKGDADVVDTLSDKELRKRNEAAKDNEIKFESDEFSTYSIVVTSISQTLEAGDGHSYTVTVDAPASAGIPQGASLQVSEVMEGTLSYYRCLDQVEENLGQGTSYARFFDITIIDKDGFEVQPSDTVNVTITPNDADRVTDEVQAVHFAKDGMEVLGADFSGDAVSFEADGFSIYGVIVLDRESNPASVQGVVPAKRMRDGSIKKLSDDTDEITITSMLAAGDKVSINSPELSSPNLEGNLYYATQGPDADGFYDKDYLTMVDYFMCEASGDDLVLVPYDAAENKLTGGTLVCVVSQEDPVPVEVLLTGVQTTTNYKLDSSRVATLVGMKYKTDKDAIQKTIYGVPGDIVNLAEVAVAEHFYYEVNTSGSTAGYEVPVSDIVPCTHAKIVEVGSSLVLQPLDSNDNPVADASIYAVQEKLFQFDVKVNEVVNEHSEDDGNAYFWVGDKFQTQRTSANQTATHPVNWGESNIYTRNASADTAPVTKTYTVTGRVGDQFIPAELGLETVLFGGISGKTVPVPANSVEEWELNNEAGIEELQQNVWYDKWVDVKLLKSDIDIPADPSSSQAVWGVRDFNHYRIAGYTALNIYNDKVYYFEIGEDANGPVLKARHADGSLLTLSGNETTRTLTYESGGESTGGVPEGRTIISYANAEGEGKDLEMFCTRGSVAATSSYVAAGSAASFKSNHIQLRMSTTIEVQIEGKTYTGDFRFVSYNDNPVTGVKNTTVAKLWGYYRRIDGTYRPFTNSSGTAFDGDGYGIKASPDTDQESEYVAIYPSSIRPNGEAHIFDPEWYPFTIEYYLTGTLTNVDDPTDVITYANNATDCFKYKVTLTSSQMREAYYACPNQGGYDVVLNIAEGIKNTLDTKDKVTVVKLWGDANNEYDTRPESITYTLERYKQGENTPDPNWTKEVTLTGNSTAMMWQATVYGLDYYEQDGTQHSYIYKVKNEVMNYPAGATDYSDSYEATYEGTTVTNTFTLDTTTYDGVKEWRDADGSPLDNEKIPDSITIGLYQLHEGQEAMEEDPGKLYATKEVKKSEDWAYSFEDLPAFYFENGQLQDYDYEVVEYEWDGIDDFDVTYEGNNIINTYKYTPELAIMKIADREEGSPITPLAGAKFELKAGTETYYLVSNAEGYLVPDSDVYSGGTTFDISYDPTTHKYVLDNNTTYELTEKDAPTGYNMLTEKVVFKWDKTAKAWTITQGTDVALLDASTVGLMYVKNTAGTVLPHTGGPGTTLFTIIGSAMCVAAAVTYGFSLRRRPRREVA